MPTEQHAANLRRKIELYRRYLREGVAAPLAAEYLCEIAAAEAELGRITGQGADRRG
jgi:hypothetical protein